MSRYICIHGHFYQPPRENAWLEAIERQDSAYPYHDWNERIDAECYSQNGASRILGERGEIARIVSNYAGISYNFGPTLLSWMQAAAPGTYAAVIEADGESARRFSGHGSAMAQAYNHMILPLANRRDRETQVEWGVRDFRHRFGRDPEGMWLPETAVDLETLETLARSGIRFVILSPWQARRTRPVGGKAWRNATGAKIDPSMAYLQRLPSGASMAVFFYDGPVSQAVAFERLLDSGEKFAGRLLDGFSDKRAWPQLMHIATDGESYGHHHRHGDMALADALDRIDKMEGVDLTNYGEFLERHPPDHEVEIAENTAWSCAHGLGRWKEDCGCSTGGRPGWNQNWRAPLRESLDWLRDELIPLYEMTGRELFHDPWKARDEYIEVILDRSDESVDGFMKRHAREDPDPEGIARRLKLLEMQRHAMLMYTSCGWFFDDLGGIETVQVIQYAGRAIQLAAGLFDSDLEPPFLERLGKAHSNVAESGTGREIYERMVLPTRITLKEVGAHYAVSSLFQEYPAQAGIYSYNADQEDHERRESGRTRLVVGKAVFTSRVTRESTHVTYGAIHLGDHNVVAGVREFLGSDSYGELLEDLNAAFEEADMPAVVRLIDKHFGESSISLHALFRDEQADILERLLHKSLEDADRVYQRIYEQNASVMSFLAGQNMQVPAAIQLAAERAINHQLRLALENGTGDADLVKRLLKEARERNVALDRATLGFAMEGTLNRLAARWRGSPESTELLVDLHARVDAARSLPFEARLWQVQNVYWDLLTDLLPAQKGKAERNDEGVREWVEQFIALGSKIGIRAE